VRYVTFIILLLSLSACTITKRHHRPGYFVSFNKHFPKVDEQVEKTDISESTVLRTDEKTSALPSVAPLPERDHSVELEVPSTRSSQDNRYVENSLSIKPFPEEGSDSTTLSQNKNEEKSSVEATGKPNMKKGWRIFWITLLVIVLFSGFIYVGARWPEAYVIWFGLSAILALFNISSSASGGSFLERLWVALIFICWGAFYLAIFSLMLPLVEAILLQFALYTILALIGLIVYLVLKKKKKQNPETLN
jgi:hypothetical protein